MNIDAVPETIPRSKTIELIKSLGIEPGELYSFTIYPHAIEAQVYALTATGGRYFYDGTENVAVHKIYIPITDPE